MRGAVVPEFTSLEGRQVLDVVNDLPGPGSWFIEAFSFCFCFVLVEHYSVLARGGAETSESHAGKLLLLFVQLCCLTSPDVQFYPSEL